MNRANEQNRAAVSRHDLLNDHSLHQGGVRRFMAGLMQSSSQRFRPTPDVRVEYCPRAAFTRPAETVKRNLVVQFPASRICSSSNIIPASKTTDFILSVANQSSGLSWPVLPSPGGGTRMISLPSKNCGKSNRTLEAIVCSINSSDRDCQWKRRTRSIPLYFRRF